MINPPFRTSGLIRFLVIAVASFFISAFSALASTSQSRQILQEGTVMGFRHYEGKRVWDNLRVGHSLTLIRESDNLHDSEAIRIEWHGQKLGYVPRADNRDLARLMDNGTQIEARIAKLEKSRRPNNRVRFEVYLPG
jgi:hypothetical protein